MATHTYDPEPAWRRERRWRKEDRAIAKAVGWRLPILVRVALVELDVIRVPDWARKKAIKGLTVTESSVWLRRIAANKLAQLDRECGGRPKVTPEDFRRCHLCDRPLLGSDAATRFDLDRKFEGHRIPCGPDCVALEAALKGKSKCQKS